MEFVHPEYRIVYEEVLYLTPAVVEYLCTPVGMLSLFGVLIFVAWSAVKVCQSMGIPGEMRGNPVEDHSLSVLVELIYQISEVIRIAVS